MKHYVVGKKVTRYENFIVSLDDIKNCFLNTKGKCSKCILKNTARCNEIMRDALKLAFKDVEKI